MKRAEEIRLFMEDLGIPGHNPDPIPNSGLRFPNGRFCRTEVISAPLLSSKSMIKAIEKNDIRLDRIIFNEDDAETLSSNRLNDYSQNFLEKNIELAVNIESNTEALRLKGSNDLSRHIEKLMFYMDSGFKGIVVKEIGVLFILSEMRFLGMLPKDVFFIFSSESVGLSHAANAEVARTLSADNLIIDKDLTVQTIAGIRQCVKLPLSIPMDSDEHTSTSHLLSETIKIVQAVSPVYLQFNLSMFNEKTPLTLNNKIQLMGEQFNISETVNNIIKEQVQRGSNETIYYRQHSIPTESKSFV